MKIKLPKLHNQILIALVLGAIFGSIFNINTKTLVINYKENNEVKNKTIKNWHEIIFRFNAEKDSMVFHKEAQFEIINEYKKLKKSKTSFDLIVKDFVYKGDKKNKIPFEKFTTVTSISKEGTIATKIKWIGDIFIRLLSMVAIPLVLASLTVGAASLGDIKKFARIGGKTIAFYLVTTALAITIGLVTANIMQPGKQMDTETRDNLISAYSDDISPQVDVASGYSILDQIVQIVPKNPFNAFAEGNMLQVVFFSVFLGLMLGLIDKEKYSFVVKFFDGLSDTIIKMVDIIMLMAPIGVFALIAATVGEFGFYILETLIWYSVAVILGLAIQTFGVYSILIKLFTKLKLSFFFKGIRRAQIIAFSTSSSAATLPVTMECAQENLGVSKSISSFVLPLGATINMDGTALYQGIAAVFIAQVFGMDLNFSQQLTIVLTATLASIGTAPVPGVGIIMLVIILKAVGIPEVGIALILGVDRILDMCRTITNITGDSSVAAAIASSENELIIPEIQPAD